MRGGQREGERKWDWQEEHRGRNKGDSGGWKQWEGGRAEGETKKVMQLDRFLFQDFVSVFQWNFSSSGKKKEKKTFSVSSFPSDSVFLPLFIYFLCLPTRLVFYIFFIFLSLTLFVPVRTFLSMASWFSLPSASRRVLSGCISSRRASPKRY